VHVHRWFGDWQLWTKSDIRDGNFRIVVDGASGVVKEIRSTFRR
jgi:hypothetical protein